MPVTTRAQSRRLQAAESRLTRKPSQAIRQPSKSTNSATFEQPPALKEDRSSARRTSQAPSDRSPPQASSEKESHQILTGTPLSYLPSTIEKAFWPCQKCSCQEGVFKGLDDNCIKCGHTMINHEPHVDDPWDPNCDELCKREDLVNSVLQGVRQNGVMVIRATPQVGKSVLLKLLGLRIAHEELELEPIYLSWEKREKRNHLPYEDYLQRERAIWQERNTRIRPRNPAARTIYLIDEAQGSYEEEAFWSMLKNYRNTRQQPLFVLVCVYGAAGVSYSRDPNIESQARRMHALHRIELRPSMPGNASMLFQQEETDLVINKSAIACQYRLGHGVVDYIHRATDGHPGMIGLLMRYLDELPKRTRIDIPTTLSLEFLHNLIVQHEHSFIDLLSDWGRGVWSPFCEGYVQDCLRAAMYSHLTLLDIKMALREVAMQPYGLTRELRDFDAFAFCHKFGLLHTEQPTLGRSGVTFTFASPLHRRVAYRRLFPGREPDAEIKTLSLLQICTNAIARFSPGALQNRQNSQSKGNHWGIPEAAFSDELYCCLSLELHYLPILSEYSHTKEGRIDFYVSDRKWGIEILQCGNNTEIAKRIARFAPGGNYQSWGILDDYIILNFCSRSAFQGIKIQDEDIQPSVFHVVIEPDKLSAAIYTHNKQLHKSWSLSEGRQREISDDFFHFDESLSNADSGRIPTQEEPTERERAMIEEVKEMKEREKEMKEREKEMKERESKREKEMKEMRLQIEQLREGMRLRTVRDEDQEETAQVQDKFVQERGKKRKR